MSDEAVPQWKSWYRWPFLLLVLCGVAMLIYGVRALAGLVDALRTLPPVIEVNTAMSACPPLGIGFIVLGGMAWLPRTADNSRLRPLRIGGRERDPGGIVILVALAALLLYPVAGIALRLVTADMLSSRGYTEETDQVSPSSRYITSHWTR